MEVVELELTAAAATQGDLCGGEVATISSDYIVLHCLDEKNSYSVK
jgi:hypothetical protein